MLELAAEFGQSGRALGDRGGEGALEPRGPIAFGADVRVHIDHAVFAGGEVDEQVLLGGGAAAALEDRIWDFLVGSSERRKFALPSFG